MWAEKRPYRKNTGTSMQGGSQGLANGWVGPGMWSLRGATHENAYGWKRAMRLVDFSGFMSLDFIPQISSIEDVPKDHHIRICGDGTQILLLKVSS